MKSKIIHLQKVALFLVFFILVGKSGIKAQDCTDFHEFNCTFADWTFFYSRQSKSALFQHGQTSSLKFIAYGGEDYYISVCTHRKFSPLRFKIFEDNEARDLLYDNISEEFINTLHFSNNRTRKLVIEVTVPEAEDEDEKDEKRCVGVLIQFKKTIGFEEEESTPGQTGF